MSSRLQKEQPPTKFVPSNISRTSVKQGPNSISLDASIQYLNGVGPKRAELFAKIGLLTIRDALNYLPYRHEDRRHIQTPGELLGAPEGSLVCVAARILSVKESHRRGRKGTIIELQGEGVDGSPMSAIWFHSFQGFREKLERMSASGELVFMGPLSRGPYGSVRFNHPEIEHKGPAGSLHWGRIVPIYSTTSGLGQRSLRETIHRALQIGIPLIEDDLPEDLRTRLQLPSISSCLLSLHYPTEPLAAETALTTEELPRPVIRLIFEEFFKYHLQKTQSGLHRKQEKSLVFELKNRFGIMIRKNLSFQLTDGQENALAEIRSDLNRSEPMSRILQGEVGSGKTLVALLALAEAADNGFQGALLAPTETLAEQHYATAKKVLAGTGIELTLVTGSMAAKEKKQALSKIASGEVSLAIGTHSLLQEKVTWKSLGLVVIDEQHRFGVKQRARLRVADNQGLVPHLLTMTATPIPRSLALTLFGDLDVSSLRELPKNRLPILTKALPGSERQKVYNLFHKEARAKHQSYLIYPLVADSEKEGMEKLKSVEAEYTRLSAGPLKGLRLAMVHGKIPPKERQDIIAKFARGETDVLIATTVIEVGIDVPNATVIAIENAERFGLAQLHQLRGRVGRGASQGYCVLLSDVPRRKNVTYFSEDADSGEGSWNRLDVLEKSADGFALAEADLKIRGPGDFLGTRQSGAPAFRFANLSRDLGLFESAKKEAQTLISSDPTLSLLPHRPLQDFFARAQERLGFTLQSG